jgi:hypothetical protein
MWTSFFCHLCRHDYSLALEPGAIFLCCVRCGHRSSGWALDRKSDRPHPPETAVVRLAQLPSLPIATAVKAPGRRHQARVLPFTRSFAR